MLVEDQGAAIPLDLNISVEQLFMEIHSSLSALISPATANSLRATSTRPGSLRFIDMPVIVKSAIIAAIVCMIGFFFTLGRPDNPSPTPQSTVDGDRSK